MATTTITTIINPVTPDGIQLDPITYKKVTKNRYYTYITKNGKVMATAGLVSKYEDIRIGKAGYEYIMDEIKEEQMYLKEDMSLTMEDVDRPDVHAGNTYDGTTFESLHEEKDINYRESIEDALFFISARIKENTGKRLELAAKCYDKTDEELRNDREAWATDYLNDLEYEEKKPSILKAIKALNKRDVKSLKKNERKVIETFDSIKYTDFEKVLIEEKILIRTSYGILQVVTAKNPVTIKDTYNSMIQLRNVLKITQRVIDNSEFGTVMGKIAWLAANDYDYVKSNDELNYNYDYGYEYAFGSDNVTDDMINELKDHFEEKVEVISIDEVDSIED